MKYLLSIILLLVVIMSCEAQRVRPSRGIQRAPSADTVYALLSDADRRYQHTPLAQWIEDNIGGGGGASLWDISDGIIYTPRDVAVGGDPITQPGASLYIHDGAAVEDRVTIQGQMPMIVFLDSTTMSRQELRVVGLGDLHARFTNQLGIKNEPTESIDAPGTARLRSIPNGADTMQIVVVDDQGVLHKTSLSSTVDADPDPTNEYNTSLDYNRQTRVLTVTDGGNALSITLSPPALVTARNDTDAANQGVAIGQEYTASTNNTMGAKPSNPITRRY